MRQSQFSTDYLGFAQVDIDRLRRQGVPEVVYGAGKTAEQISGILDSLRRHGQLPAIVTRVDAVKAAAVSDSLGPEFVYFPEARFGRLGAAKAPDGHGCVVVAAAGTSDLASRRQNRPGGQTAEAERGTLH